MKSLLYTLMAVVAIAYLGSFLGIWVMPHQQEPFTYGDFWAKVLLFLPEIEIPRPDNVNQD